MIIPAAMQIYEAAEAHRQKLLVPAQREALNRQTAELVSAIPTLQNEYGINTDTFAAGY